MKMTKKFYTSELARINNRIGEVQAILAEALATNGANLNHLDEWNEYHDEETDLGFELKDLENAWSTRNWTAGQWNSWKLVANNID